MYLLSRLPHLPARPTAATFTSRTHESNATKAGERESPARTRAAAGRGGRQLAPSLWRSFLMSPHRRRVLSLLARHVVVPAAASTADDADDKGAAARAIEGRLQELQAEKDSLQLEVGRLTGVGVPREFFRSASPDETAEFFRRNGYWLFEDAVQGEWLARLQEKWLEAAAPARELWEQGGGRSTPVPIHVPDLRERLKHGAGFFDIPRFIEHDDSMLRLLSNPAIISVLELVMGGKVQVNQIQGRTVPAEVPIDKYTHWHRDGGADDFTMHPMHSSNVKVFTFPWAISTDGGCAAVVPGLHRTNMVAPDNFVGSRTPGDVAMPHHVSFPLMAGTAIAYDNRIWHNALPNTTRHDRCCLICSYKPYGTMMQSGQVIANAKRLHTVGKLGPTEPLLRQLLGWRLGLGEVDFSDPEHHERNPTADNR